MRKLSMIAIAAIVVLALSLIAYATITFTIHQTLTVPTAKAFTVYQSDGLTPVASMQDVSTLWSWTGSQFVLQLVIVNTGNSILTTSFNVSGGGLSGWNFIYGGNGSLAIGGNQGVSITAVPPNTNGGTTTGDFDLSIVAN